jgi:hypothetical protein
MEKAMELGVRSNNLRGAFGSSRLNCSQKGKHFSPTSAQNILSSLPCHEALALFWIGNGAHG